MPAPLMNVRLPEEEAQALTRLAAEQGRTRSELVREALRAVLAESRRPPRKGRVA